MHEASGIWLENEDKDDDIMDNEIHIGHSWTYVHTRNRMHGHRPAQLAYKEGPNKCSNGKRRRLAPIDFRLIEFPFPLIHERDDQIKP